MTTFALLAFLSVRRLAYRQVHIIRLSHDRQLTAMVLFQVIFLVILTLPRLIFYIYSLNTYPTDFDSIARNQRITAIVNFIYIGGFSCSFYIYCCVSKRFRKQLIYVLIYIHLNRWRQWMNQMNNNQVTPQPATTNNNEQRREIPTLIVENIEQH
ncbi:unnamed protein product [Rotaria sp. Silwood1]|nr:unnamed protein product [Rotaria sp. Silwood1]CAF1413504.1 unnamed protein product [Rotaria sp. Silwood1]CAF3637828.1 unnamed protein product [Rotaria sp. Silwood1]CAF3653377.1 unnamed protein product [Rotaria sp. Silwood1]CAF3701023.1 unnamed protein product [Rotaria sp. Silwood1]